MISANQKLTKLKNRLDGGGKRDRTDDLLHAMQALSQLSYTPICVGLIPRRIEPRIIA